eukprot:3000955-Rhodomonas_salina.2
MDLEGGCSCRTRGRQLLACCKSGSEDALEDCPMLLESCCLPGDYLFKAKACTGRGNLCMQDFVIQSGYFCFACVDGDEQVERIEKALKLLVCREGLVHLW